MLQKKPLKKQDNPAAYHKHNHYGLVALCGQVYIVGVAKLKRGSDSATLSRNLEAAMLRSFLGAETKEANREPARISRLARHHSLVLLA